MLSLDNVVFQIILVPKARSVFLLTVDGEKFSWRPPWLDIQTASAPFSTASNAAFPAKEEMYD